MAPQPQNVFVTRLHVRYDAESFPEDLQLQATGDRENFQGRYVMRHPWEGSATCEAADRYRRELGERREREARTLSELTGWTLADIRESMNLGTAPGEPDAPGAPDDSWWRSLWPNG